MLSLLLALVVYGGPLELSLDSHCDVIEYNHYYDEAGHEVFTQLILYRWDSKAYRFQVTDWRLVKSPGQYPQWDSRRRRWYAMWHDVGYLRRVFAPSFRETWTQYDVELHERQYVPESRRDSLLLRHDRVRQLPQ